MVNDLSCLSNFLHISDTKQYVVIFDFDGVFTDNSVYVDENGNETVMCSRFDGIGITKIKKAGFRTFVLSTESNKVVSKRCEKLQIECHQGVVDKGAFLSAYLYDSDIESLEILYVGNDENDIPASKFANYVICVADAHESFKSISDFQTQRSGGRGAVREVCDMLVALKQGEVHAI